MEISGFTYRSIAAQNEFSYDLNVSINNSTGISTFGFSGDREYLQLFTFNSGKILDLHKRHVWSYNPRENIYISGNVGSGYLNYFINNTPICLFSFNSGNYFKYVNFYSQFSIANFNFNIFGSQPNYSFITPITGVDLGQNIIAQIKNDETNINKSFEIFSGRFIGQPYYSLNSFSTNFISGSRTGNLIFNYSSEIPPITVQSGIPPVTGVIGTLILDTNFGEIRTQYNFSINSPPFYFVDFANIFYQLNSINNFKSQRNYQYRLNTLSSNDQNIHIRFSNLQGHNNNVITGILVGTGIITSNVISGFIYGEDYITGIGTGIIYASEFDYNNQIISKLVTGINKQIQFATGQINYFYNTLITGVSSVPTFLKDYTLIDSQDDFLNSDSFFGKSIAVSRNGNIAIVGSTGINNGEVIGQGDVKIYVKNPNINEWILNSTLSPNQETILFRTGISPTITGFLTGINLPENSEFSFNTQGVNIINLIEGIKSINIFVTGNYGPSLQNTQPLFAEWLESDNNNFYFNFNLTDSNGSLRTSSFESNNGLYTGYLSTSTRFLKLNFPFLGGSGAITGLIDISYLDSSSQGMNFGYSVDIHQNGSIIAVGAPRFTINNQLKDIGSVWVYTGINNNWNLDQVITGISTNQYFGESLAIGEKILAIGGRSSSGVRVYSRESPPAQKPFYSGIDLLTGRVTGFRGFGYSLDISRNDEFIAVGTPSNNLNFPNFYNSGEVNFYVKRFGVGGYSWPLLESARLRSNVRNSTKIFFPVLGNHDYDVTNPATESRIASPFLSYFSLLNKIINNTSNNSKYYDFRIGPIHFFILDSEPVSGGSSIDGNIQNGAGIGDDNPLTASNVKYAQEQKEWFNKTISKSNAKYKFVFFHHPSFNTGGNYRGFPNLSPYKGWKIHLADGVFNGHEHLYERLSLSYQNHSYINVTRNNNQLTITYGSPGLLLGTSQLRINIGYDDFKEASLQNMSFNSNTNQWFFTYDIPSNADYINFYFQSANNNLDRNTLNTRDYDYIYYLNDSNNFTKTVYNIVGNGGVDLRTVRNDAGFLNWAGYINADFYGFTRVDIYENGIKFTHYGIRNGALSLQIEDIFNVGNVSTPILLSFAATADWGKPTNGVLTQPTSPNFKNPGNNFFVEKIASTIRNQNINYIFGVGDLNYTFTSPLNRPNTSTPIYIDENIGQFYFDYMPCYRGIFTGYRQLNSSLLPLGLQLVSEDCRVAKFGINNSTWGNTTIDGFGESVSIGGYNNNMVAVGGGGNIGYLNNGSVWMYTGIDNWFTPINGSLLINQNINNLDPNSSGDSFGSFVNLNEDGNLLTISSISNNNNSGIVYLYTGNNRFDVKQQITQPNKFGQSINFGFNVKNNKDGSLVFVGSNTNNGSLYIYNSDIYTNLVSNQTGLLTGLIAGNQSSFTWNNVSITGTGLNNNVFIDKITGYRQATGSLIFLNSTGSGLNFGDTITINNVNFTYTQNPFTNFQFNSLDNFVNIINSGITGNDISLNNLGVTGIKNSNQIILYSYSRSGLAGNSIRLSRNSQNVDAIKIPSRYFQGGQDLRPLVSNWSGLFSGFFNTISQENSGFYILNNIASLYSENLTGIIWIDTFNKWIIQTGVTLESQNPDLNIFSNVIYNPILNIYSGILKVNKSNNYLSAFTSLFINFIKPIYIENNQIIFNNLANYSISGDNFIYTGILTG
jgi:hypothetical protein